MEGRKPIWLGTLAFILLCGLLGSFYVVDSTDRANVRMFGVPQYECPVGPGLHFKIPFITSVDTLQVSLTTLHILPFEVTTVDNQKVTLDLNFNYTIPDDKVNHLLYNVGRAGSVDIESQVIPVAKDRAGRIFSAQNMTTVNANRAEIQRALETAVVTSVKDLFGIEPHSLQIAGVVPSEAFMKSNEDAVKAKNAAVAAENTKNVVQFQTDQVVIKAKGDADSAIQAARGQSQSILLVAEAFKTKQILEGQGLESRLASEIKPFGSADKYIEYLNAQAKLKWNGQQPQVIAGNGGSTNLILPINNLPTPTK